MRYYTNHIETYQGCLAIQLEVALHPTRTKMYSNTAANTELVAAQAALELIPLSCWYPLGLELGEDVW